MRDNKPNRERDDSPWIRRSFLFFMSHRLICVLVLGVVGGWIVYGVSRSIKAAAGATVGGIIGMLIITRPRSARS